MEILKWKNIISEIKIQWVSLIANRDIRVKSQ